MKKNLVLLRETGIILGAAIVLAFGYNAFSPKPLPLVRTETTTVASDSLITALTATRLAAVPVANTAPNVQKSAGQTPQQLTPQTPEHEKASPKPSSDFTQTQPKASVEQTSPPKISPSAPKEATSQAPSSATPENKTETKGQAKALEIRFDQVEKLLTNPDVLFIDARPAREYELGHIGQAINIYTPEFEQNIGRVIGLPREKPIVAYCGGGACELSHELADNLVKMGFTRVFVYVGGWNEWKQKKP